MNKEELVQAVASKTNMPKTASQEAIDAVFEAIGESLISHEDVSIAGFGKFAAKYQKARDARNPKTGENIKVPARFSVKFSPSSILKNAVAK
jgi:DNA-binding protein HU-beta